MRILALSDVWRWDGCERLVDKWKPDVLALAGDLTSDGTAAFWHEALELIPDFQKERQSLYERVGDARRRGNACTICRDGPTPPYEKYTLNRHDDFMFFDHVRQLEDHFQKRKAFAAAQRRVHVDKFYRFLRYAGERATVLIIKGDHDDDFAGTYDADRINKIPGCQEISGKTCEFQGEFFLGVSYQFIAYRRVSKSLLAQFPQRGGIVVAHARQRNVHLLAELKPKLIIRGHFDYGIHRVCGIPAVFTSGGHAVIDTGKIGSPRVRQPSPQQHVVHRVAPYDTEPR